MCVVSGGSPGVYEHSRETLQTSLHRETLAGSLRETLVGSRFSRDAQGVSPRDPCRVSILARRTRGLSVKPSRGLSDLRGPFRDLSASSVQKFLKIFILRLAGLSVKNWKFLKIPEVMILAGSRSPENTRNIKVFLPLPGCRLRRQENTRQTNVFQTFCPPSEGLQGPQNHDFG